MNTILSSTSWPEFIKKTTAVSIYTFYQRLKSTPGSLFNYINYNSSQMLMIFLLTEIVYTVSLTYKIHGYGTLHMDRHSPNWDLSIYLPDQVSLCCRK